MVDEHTEYIVYEITMKKLEEYEDAIIEPEEKEYRPYREKLHPYKKRRCFKPKIHWKRTRSNPR